MPRRFEYVGGKSAKFWEASVVGSSVTVRYGRLGTDGHTQSKSFANGEVAQRHAAKLIAGKTKKGYREVVAS